MTKHCCERDVFFGTGKISRDTADLSVVYLPLVLFFFFCQLFHCIAASKDIIIF